MHNKNNQPANSKVKPFTEKNDDDVSMESIKDDVGAGD